MRVIVPYRTLLPIQQKVLASYRLPVTFALCNDDDAYRRILRDVWAERQTVVLIEHDVLPWPGAVEELHHCMGLWCSCSYLYGGGYGLYHGLGCTKLNGLLMEALPALWDQPGHWSTLDRRLLFAAREIGQEPHPHRPSAIHLSAKELALANEVNDAPMDLDSLRRVPVARHPVAHRDPHPRWLNL